MRIFDTINDENFELYAAKHYDNPQCVDIEEFQADLCRFKYIKRLLGRYDSCGELQERLILNHIIVLFNVFGIEAAKKMLLFKIDSRHYSVIKPFLILLHYLREDELIDVPLDENVVAKLRNI